MVARLISSEITAMAWSACLAAQVQMPAATPSPAETAPPGASQWLPISSSPKLMKDDSQLNRAGQLRAPA
jgi:hypothetical protein